jgi:hypothetical protein
MLELKNMAYSEKEKLILGTWLGEIEGNAFSFDITKSVYQTTQAVYNLTLLDGNESRIRAPPRVVVFKGDLLSFFYTF